MRARTRPRLVLLIVAMATLTGGLTAFPSVPASSSTAVPTARNRPAALTVATFNVLTPRSGVAWKPRRARVLELIKRARADVVVLQEAEGPTDEYFTPVGEARARDLSSLWLARKAGLELAPLYGYTEPPYPSRLRHTRKGPHVLYDARRLTQLTDVCDQDHLGGTSFGTFVDRRTGRPLQVIGVHLAAGTTKQAQRTRAAEIRDQDRFTRHCRQPWRLAMPRIWAGDFNTTGRPLRRDLKRRGLVDSVTIARKRTNHRVNTFNGRRRLVVRDGVRIDQVWVPRGSKVRSWKQLADIRDGRYVGRFGSDHNPVVVRLTLPR